MSQLILFLLGTPRIECDDKIINLDTRKAIALMAYLAVTKQPQSRDTLAALLWPEYDQVHARATLRRTLSTLNKALAGPWLEIEREHVSLNFNAGVWIDVHEFHNRLADCGSHNHPLTQACAACLQPLSEAIALYRGDFLAGFSLRDSPNFDDWQFLQADALRHNLASALERLAQCYSATSDFEPAIACARRWLSLDRLNESAHRLLMQLYAWNGQRSAALHQYRECIQVLERELGVAPLESTTQLYQAIKEHQAIPLPPQHSLSNLSEVKVIGAMPLTLNTPSAALSNSRLLTLNSPLVGRSTEWSTLMEVYSSIRTTGHLIILEGEAGIGKTRLAEEFLTYTQTKGANVIAAKCYEGETQLAFGPVAAGFHVILAREDAMHRLEGIPLPWLSEVARLLPELLVLHPGLLSPLPLESPGAQSRFFEGLRQLLIALCKGTQPGIIFFDDIQWADGATLDLLSYLVRRLHEQPVCLIVTWRSKQVLNNSHLHHLKNEALRAGNATVVSLSRFDLNSVRELVQSATPAGIALSGKLIERLYQETEGLPFFLIEYLLAIKKGLISPEKEDWSPPGSVRELLNSRLNIVSETGRQLLSTASVIGRSFDFDTLREVSGRSEEETVVALEELLAQGLVEEVHTGAGEQALQYDFTHERLRALVSEETSLARLRLLHRRVAEALVGHAREYRTNSDMLAGQIAYHYRLAGYESIAAEYFKIAGDYARSLYANAEALSHFQMALALGYPDTAVLHENIGDLYTLLGEYSNAIKCYETAAALCAPADLANVERKLGSIYVRRGEWDLAESHFEAALDALGDDGSAGERARVYADWSLAVHHRGKIVQALNLAQQALNLAESANDTRALAQAHNILGILASKQHKPKEAQYHLERSLALAKELNDPGVQVAALNNLALVCKSNGEIERAMVLTQDALALCRSQGDRHREAALHSNLADLFHADGNSEAAMSHLKQSAGIFAEIGLDAGTMRPEIWKLVEW